MSSPIDAPFDLGSPADMPDQDTDSMMREYQQRVSDELSIREILKLSDAEKNRILREQQAKSAGTTMGAPEQDMRGSRVIGRAARDVGRGVVETFSGKAPIHGAIKAVNETPDAIYDTIVGPLMEASGIPDYGITLEMKGPAPTLKIVTPEQRKAMRDTTGQRSGLVLPNVPEPESQTGKTVAAFSQFLVGFVGAGKIKKLKALESVGGSRAAMATALRGAAADFTVFDAQEDNLSALLQQYPALENPVTEFLATDQEDPEVLNRLRRAVEGIGLGAATSVASKAFVSGLRILRKARTTKPLIENAASASERELASLEQTVDASKKQFKTVIGDPEAPLVSRRTQGEESEIFINSSRIDAVEDVQTVIKKMADMYSSEINASRGGATRSFETMKSEARNINGLGALIRRREESVARGVAQPLSDAEMLAARDVWVDSAKKIVDLVNQRKADPGSDVLRIALAKQFEVHRWIQAEVIGARTAAARSVASMRIPRGGTALEFAQSLESSRILVDQGKSIDAMTDAIFDLSQRGNAEGIEKVIQGSAWAKSADMVRQLWYSSILSGFTIPRTLVSQVAVMAQQLGERRLAGQLGKMAGVDGVVDGEALSMLHGMLTGFKSAVRSGAIKEAWTTGRAAVGRTKDMPPGGAFAPETLGVELGPGYNEALRWIDAITTAPQRGLAAIDAGFQMAGMEGEIAARSLRQAIKEAESGLIPRELISQRSQELMANPEDYMKLAGAARAQEVTFTRQPGQDERIYKAMRAVQKVPVIGRVVMPFSRTPYEIARYHFQRTPIALATKTFRDSLASGGAEAELAWARMMAGTGILALATELAMGGRITGGYPDSANARQQLPPGWQPYSVKVGDRYIPFRGYEPVASLLTTAGDLVQILGQQDFGEDNKDLDDVIVAATMAVANQLTSAQYMSGVSGFFEAMSDPTRYGESYFNRIAGSAVPGLVAQTNKQFVDPIQREVTGALDAIKSRTWGLSKDLPIKYDFLGRPIPNGSIFGVPEKAEPIDKELAEIGAYVERPSRRQFFRGVPVNMELFPKEYSRFLQLQGNELKLFPSGFGGLEKKGLRDTLNDIVTDSHNYSYSYFKMKERSPELAEEMLRKYMNAAKVSAREELLKESPALRAYVDEQLAKKRGLSR